MVTSTQLAAPPLLTAADERQAQMDKLPAYNASLDSIAAPLIAGVFSRLEQGLQLAKEDPRPKTSANTVVSVMNVDPLDRTAVLDKIEQATVARFQPRGFVVLCTRPDGNQTLAITLAW